MALHVRILRGGRGADVVSAALRPLEFSKELSSRRCAFFLATSPRRAARAPFGVTRAAALPLEGRLRAQAARQARGAKVAGAQRAETLRAQRMLPTEDLAAAPLLSSTSLRVFLKTEAILLATCCAFSVPNTCLTRAMYWALVRQAFFCL